MDTTTWTKSATLGILAAVLAGCGGGGAEPASSQAWSLTGTTAGARWDVALERMALQGAVCKDASLNYELLLKVGGTVVATSQTEWAVEADHFCAGFKRFSGFRLQWPAKHHADIVAQGATLEIRQNTSLVHSIQVPAGLAGPTNPRVALTTNSSPQGIAGKYCVEDGAPFVRGSLQQPDWVVSVQDSPATHDAQLQCLAASFEVSAAQLQAQAVAHHWFSGDELTLWQGSQAHAAPVAAMAWRASDQVHSLNYLEAGANVQEDMLRMPFTPNASLYPARGRPQKETFYESGWRQGLSSVLERQSGRESWGRLQLLGLDKRLNTPDPLGTLGEFARGYRAAGGQPSAWYVLDEPFWKSFGGLVEPELQSEYIKDYQAVVDTYHQVWPGVPLMAAVNGVVLNDQVLEDAKKLLAGVDYLGFDPYTVYSSLIPSLYEDGMRARAADCPVQAWDRLDVAVSRCLAKVIPTHSGQKVGWIVQGFLVNEGNMPGFKTYPVHTQSLQRHWRAMRQVAVEHADRTFAVGSFGFRLSEHSLINEPMLVRGADLESLAPVHADIRSFAGK